MTINVPLDFTSNDFQNAIYIYEHDWRCGINELNPLIILQACLAVQLPRYEFLDILANTLTKGDKEKLVKGFTEAYSKYITQKILAVGKE